MTIDTTYPPTPPRPPKPRRRPARGRRGIIDRRRRYQRIDIRRRRSRFDTLPPPIDPSAALEELMREGDFYMVRRRPYLVVPVSDELLDALIVAAGAREDEEPSLCHGQARCDAVVDGELSTDCSDDLESDGLYDQTGIGWRPGGEMTLGWANEGSQEFLSGHEDEIEPDLGCSDTGSQLKLHAGDEGDGDCDDEEDDPPGGNIDDEPHDEPFQDLEPSLCGVFGGWHSGIDTNDYEGGSGGNLTDADIDAQRGRIASRWPESDGRVGEERRQRERTLRAVQRLLSASSPTGAK